MHFRRWLLRVLKYYQRHRALFKKRTLRKTKLPIVVSLLIVFVLGSVYERQFMAVDDQGLTRDENLEPFTTYHDCEAVELDDGDSLTLDCEHFDKRILFVARLAGIDAPEMGQSPWGTFSRDYLFHLVLDKQLTVVVLGRDRYERYLIELFDGVKDDDRDIALQMVKAGKAIVYKRYTDKPSYLKAEQQAKQEKLGIWSKDGAHQLPEKWRHLNL